MNQKGQAFSVFQLLIAALIAIAILAVLFQVLGFVNFGVGNDPDSTSEELMNKANNKPYTLQQKKVTFTPEKKQVPREGLAKQVGLLTSEICLAPGDLENNFNNSENSGLSYTGNQNLDATMSVICTDSIDSAEQNMLELLGRDDLDLPSGDLCCDDSSVRCCLLVLSRFIP